MARERAFDLCIFDWNGTLRDDLHHIYECGVERIFRHFGLPCPDIETYRNEVGYDYMATFYWPHGIPRNVTSDELKTLMRQGFAERGGLPPLFPDALPTVGRVRDLGCRCALVSAYGQVDLNAELRECGLAGMFEAAIGDARDKAGIFASLMAMCGAGPSRTAVVGDMEDDARAADIVGASAFICHRGFHSEPRLQAAAAGIPKMVIIGSLSEFLDFIEP